MICVGRLHLGEASGFCRGYGGGYRSSGSNFGDAEHRRRGGGSNSRPRGYKHEKKKEPSVAVTEAVNTEKETEPDPIPISEAMVTESVMDLWLLFWRM